MIGERQTVPARKDDPHVRVERFEHSGTCIDILLPRSSEELIDEEEFATDERLPYWAELWPSARGLARELLDLPELPNRSIELGCGVGLPSLALRSRGSMVLASDYYQEALDFTAANAIHNQIDPPELLLLDWRRPPEIGHFDLVFGADLLYERRNLDALIRLVPGILAPGGVALFADPGRIHFEPFLEGLESQGLTTRALPYRLEDAPAGRGMQTTVKLVLIHR